MIRRLSALMLVLLLALSVACSPAKTETTTAAAAAEMTTEAVAETKEAAVETKEAAVETTLAEADTTKEAPAVADDVKSDVKTVTDMTGRKLEITKPIERVVAVTPSDCEILYALGAGKLLVGRGTYANYPAEVLEVAEVASGKDMNAEQIIALTPDLVLMSTMAQSDEQVKLLEKAGILVAVSDAKTIAEVYEAIGMIGQLVDKESEASELSASMEKRFADVKAAAPKDNDKSIYFEVSPLEYGLWTAGKNTFMDEIATLVGYKNAFNDVDGWGEVSEEQVLERDPDVIVTIAMYFGEGLKPIEEIKGRPAWKDLKAVKHDALFNADNDEISRPGPRLADAAEALQAFLAGLKD